MSKKENNNLMALRHSTEHILTQAMLKLYPGLKMAMGPATETGFYFDFDYKKKINKQDFPKIEKEMQKIINKNLIFKKQEIQVSDARKLFPNNPYKQEWLDEIEEKKEKAIIYKTGNEFVDLCAGPHVKSTGNIKAFKLTKIAGAYWRGSEKNKMLTRIYGVAFPSKKKLISFLEMQKQAEKRDHRKIGKEQELFLIDEEFGKGLILWMPKGALLRKAVMDFALNSYMENGYKLVSTPHIANLKLWKRSGHWGFYQESMYSPMEKEGEFFMIKPMNCPGHVKIYDSKIRSYRDLPLRYAEMGTVYRFEKSGVLHGLTRVRGFTQDDAHIFCAPEQLHSELIKMIDLTEYILKSFEFKDFKISLSARDPKNKEKYLGDDKTWNLAESVLENALKEKKLSYTQYPGEAVFYGPKIDFLVKDAIGREWQLTTIQVDFNFPEKFDLHYIDKKGQKKRPIMLHRALLGSLERFIGVLIEHYGGAFPLWLAPEQIWVIPIGSDHNNYAQNIYQKLKEKGFKVKIQDEAETVSKKIRNGEMQKIPYILVIGDKEIKEKSISIRKQGKGDIGKMKLEEFIKKIQKEIKEKK